MQCSGDESRASVPGLLKRSRAPCHAPKKEPKGQNTHACTNADIHTHTQIQPADSFPSTAYQDVDASSTQRTRFSQPFSTSLRLGSCVIGGGVYYYIWCHMSQEEIDRRVRRPCCPAVAFLSCYSCCLFSSHLYIYLPSAGNP